MITKTATPTAPEPLLVDEQVARSMLGGIGRTLLYELIDAGEVRRVKLGRRTTISVESIRGYVARLEASAAGAPV
jgi:hypothetical protein